VTLNEAKSKLGERTTELEASFKEYLTEPSSANARTLKDAIFNHQWAVGAVQECKRRYAMEKKR